jgi:resolvase-like protein
VARVALAVTFVSLKDNLDLSTPSGRFMFQIIAAFAELERAMIQETGEGWPTERKTTRPEARTAPREGRQGQNCPSKGRRSLSEGNCRTSWGLGGYRSQDIERVLGNPASLNLPGLSLKH